MFLNEAENFKRQKDKNEKEISDLKDKLKKVILPPIKASLSLPAPLIKPVLDPSIRPALLPFVSPKTSTKSPLKDAFH